jgi:hypothetical protein
MKKALYILFFLLLLLILSCLYTKTYNIYLHSSVKKATVIPANQKNTLLSNIQSSLITLLSKNEPTKHKKYTQQSIIIPVTVDPINIEKEEKILISYLNHLLKKNENTLEKLLEEILKERQIAIKRKDQTINKK